MGTDMFRCNFNWSPDPEGAEQHASANVIPSAELTFDSLNDLLRGEECLVLRGSGNQEPCEMQLTISPLYLVRGVSIIVECPIIEMYYGRLREYNQTCHGELVYSVDDGQVYRYDIRITTEIHELHVKFIMNDTTEPVCLYTTRLYLTRNTDPMRTMRMMAGESGRINPVAVQHRLKGTTLSDSAEKCKYLILGSMLSAQQNVINNNIGTILVDSALSSGNSNDLRADTLTLPASILAAANNNAQLLAAVVGDSGTPSKGSSATGTNDYAVGSSTPPLSSITPEIGSHLSGVGGLDRNFLMNFETIVKRYIDAKFVEFEKFVDTRLASMEARQDKKLDRVIELLQRVELLSSNDAEASKCNQEE